MPASPIGYVTVEQLLRSQSFIQGVFSRIGATGNVFQKFFGLDLTGPLGQAPVPPGVDVVAWDYFDNTRTIAEVRPSISGPSRPVARPVGVANGALIRFYEALLLEHNRIAGFRPMGKPVGTLDKNGEAYVARQLKALLQRQMNAREFAVSRLFRNGFDIKHLGGDRQILVEAGSGQTQVRYQIPTDHTGQLPLLSGAANIITTKWATSSADVIGQWHNLRQVSERESGMMVKHAFISSQPYVSLINNDKLRAAGGSAFRVWEDVQTRKMETMDKIRERGEDVVFRALPNATFHVYDGVLNIDQDRDSSAIADVSQFIPNDRAIITPEPGEWIGQAAGQEYVTKNYGGQPEVVSGSANWTRNIIEPVSGVELHVWAKFLPILYVPKAVYYATVDF